MKKIVPLLLLIVLLVISCDSEEEDNGRSAWFTLTYRNIGASCNSTNLNFTFLVTRSSDGLQATQTVAKGVTVSGNNLGFTEGTTLNVQVFAASSEEPLHEANIPFIYTNYTDEQLNSNDNELQISYCHQEDTGNITWVFDI